MSLMAALAARKLRSVLISTGAASAAKRGPSASTFSPGVSAQHLVVEAPADEGEAWVGARLLHHFRDRDDKSAEAAVTPKK